jgi:mannose-6-phosphate isomerase-like protein (cupin superfamily)
MHVLEPYRQFSDARGSMLGVINAGSWEEINLVETGADQRRGGHFHRETRELFLMLEGRIRVRIARPGQPVDIREFGAGEIFVIEPHEAHWFDTLTPCKWINVLSKRMSAESPDIVPVADVAA